MDDDNWAILAPLALILASLATQLWQIYLSEGLLFGIGGSLVFCASVALPAQWFKRNRAFTSGIGNCGSGVGGLVFSLVTQALVDKTGYRMTLRYLGIIIFVLLIVACILARPRWPALSLAKLSIFDGSLLTTDFMIFMCFGVFIPFAYFTVFFLLPGYDTTIGPSSSQSSAIIGLMSACNAIGHFTLGFLADRFGRINAMLLTTSLSGMFIMLVCIEVKSVGGLYAFAILFGLTGGCYFSLMPPVTADLVDVRKIQLGFGLASSSMILGGLFGPTIAGLLADQYGFTTAIEFTGTMTITSYLFLLYLRQRRAKGKIFRII
ncbi:major facilitator superfamily domain-containing protein [Umbelopsis sp. PMI_123]|nr:major facilitator superfamily domain-containing protein [Umbelopsis sp. PMI_123]